MLHKNLANSLKDVDARAGTVCAYASSFNVVDDGADMVIPGAYTKTIAEQGPGSRQPRIKFLYQHDTSAILGVPQVLKEDGFGLYFEAKIVPTALGKDVLALYEAGCITEHSIGYEVVQAEWDRSHAVRLLKELRLFECSAVTFGMNPETPTVGVKSLADPSRLTSMADQAARLDSILHSGNLRSDALCADLERQLKALQTALAPSPAIAASQPYSIQGVLDSMNDLRDRLGRKGASGKADWPLGERDAAWDGGAAHKRIVDWATKSDGSVDTGKLKSVHFYSPDGDAAENVSDYKLLYCDVVGGSVKAMPKAIFACAGSHGVDATTGISDSDKASIRSKISAYYKRMAKQFDDDTIVAPWDKDDGGKAAHMDTILVKGSGGDIAVSKDGTHAAYTGAHTHSHATMGSQGDDEMHSHSHTHDEDASHDHLHSEPKGHTHGHTHPHKTPDGRPVRKARDFGTLFASLNASDQLQDDWGDTFIAFVQCMEELMWQASAQANGWTPEGADTVDIGDAAQNNLNAFTDAVMDLVNRSIAADFVPQMTCDRDQFIDPDGPNAESDGDDYGPMKGRAAQHIAGEPARLPRKEGREFSKMNRAYITSALNGIAEHVKGIMEHHGGLVDLMNKTDPDHTRQDEDSVLGDSDEENGGTSPNKSRQTSYTPRRTTAERTSQAGTTHQGSGTDLSAIVADLDALKGRLVRTAGGKVQ